MTAPNCEAAQTGPGPGRCLILANPKAGALSRRTRLERRLRAIRRQLSLWFTPRRALHAQADPDPALPDALTLLASLAAESGIEANVELIPPSSQLSALVRRAQAEGFDTIVAVGGDGTVRSVAQSLVHSPLRLGILPMGTANNVAHSLGIPFELAEAMRALAQGVERQVDVGWIGNHYFLEAAGVGLFADAFQALGREEARPWQVVRLLKLIGPLIWNLRSRTLALTLDDKDEKEDALFITVANGRYFGEGMTLAPEASPFDGLFDVVIVGALTRLELLRFGRALMRGTHLLLPKVRVVQAHTIEIRRIHRSHRSLPVHADDQIVGRTPARMDVLPGAIRVITPKCYTEVLE